MTEVFFFLLQCNNPKTKEPKLTAAARIVPEWVEYDNEIKQLLRRVQEQKDTETHNQSDSRPRGTKGLCPWDSAIVQNKAFLAQLLTPQPLSSFSFFPPHAQQTSSEMNFSVCQRHAEKRQGSSFCMRPPAKPDDRQFHLNIAIDTVLLCITPATEGWDIFRDAISAPAVDTSYKLTRRGSVACRAHAVSALQAALGWPQDEYRGKALWSVLDYQVAIFCTDDVCKWSDTEGTSRRVFNLLIWCFQQLCIDWNTQTKVVTDFKSSCDFNFKTSCQLLHLNEFTWRGLHYYFTRRVRQLDLWGRSFYLFSICVFLIKSICDFLMMVHSGLQCDSSPSDQWNKTCWLWITAWNGTNISTTDSFERTFLYSRKQIPLSLHLLLWLPSAPCLWIQDLE